MTPLEAETRIRIAQARLWSAQRCYDAATLIPPKNRRATVRKARIAALAADDLRRAEAEYRAAMHAAQGVTRA